VEYQEGDEAVELNYQGRVRILGPVPGLHGVYFIEGVGWEMPPWDDSCHEDNLIPVKVMARFDTREVW
jgi:hypothetical protein